MKAAFDVKMNVKTMYNFLMSHTYSGISGYLSHIIGLGMLVLFFATFGEVDSNRSVLYAVFGIWFMVYLPVSLYSKSVKQVKLNPVYKKPLSYIVDENGITTTQGEQKAEVTWEQILRVKETKVSFLVYTGRSFCFIFPKEAIGGTGKDCKRVDPKKSTPRKGEDAW